MKFKNLVKESLDLLEKSDQGIVFQTFDNQFIHVADAAHYSKEVYPTDLVKALDEMFESAGFPIKEKAFRDDLKDLLDRYEKAKMRRPKRLL
jgi:hypothetical protein